MVVEVPVKGYFAENCYFYLDDETLHGFLIDPGAEAEELLMLIREHGWAIEKILLTHGHFDHMGAAEELRDALGVPVMAHRRSDEYLLNARRNLSAFCGPSILVKGVQYLDDGDLISLEGASDMALKAIYAPGHTTDSVLYYSEKEGVAFVGDVIFKGSIGTWQYPGGDRETLLQSIQNKVFTLPEETVLCSGHSEQTTVREEKRRYL